MEESKSNGLKADEISVSGIHVEWRPQRGTCTFQKKPVAMMWVDTTLAGLMSGVQAMLGTERFLLALQSEGRKSVEADWEVIAQFPDFREGFKAIANIAAVAGWGEWLLAFFDEDKKECRFRITDSWEGRYQKALGVCWGSGMMAGKMSGYCSKLFGTNCWADQTAFIARGDAFDEFVVRPSSRSLEIEIENLLVSDEATRADMAVALKRLEEEIAEREKADRHIARLATFPQLNPNPVLEIDFSGRITFYNAATLKVLAQLGSAEGIEAFLPQDIATILKEARQTGQNQFRREVKIENSFFEEHISIPEGLNVARIYAWDITARKQAEDELNQKLREMTLLNKISHLVSSSISLEHMVHATVNGIAEYLDTDLVLFFLKEDASLPLLVVGPQDSRYKFDSVPVHCIGECLCGLAAQDGQPKYSQDISTDPRCTMVECKEAGLQSFAALPLKSVDQVIGILGLASGTPRDFEKQSQLLETIAAEISIGLKHALLLEEATKRTEELSQEVAERSRAEEALRESEARHRTILQTAMDGFWRVDLQGRLLEVNEAYCRMSGYSEEELLSMSISELEAAETPADIAAHIQKIMTQGEDRFETRHRRKDGSIIEVEISVQSKPAESGPLVVFLRDITARKQDEVKFLKEKQVSETIIDSLPGVFYFFDDQGRFLRWNTNFEQVTGYTSAEFVELTPLEFFAGEDKNLIAQAIQEVFLRGANTAEAELVTKDGSKIPYFFTGRRLDLGGTPCLIGMGIDITERNRAEELLKLNELRLEALVKLNQMANAPLSEITHFAMEEATRLTGSKIGYVAFMNEDETVLTMHAWSKAAMAECRIADKPLLYPLETTGLWGEAVRQRQPVITNDYTAANPWKKGYPEGHVKVVKHMNVPVFDGDKIVIVAGVGNKSSDYNESDVRQLILLMEGMWRIVQRKRAEDELRESEERLKFVLEGSQQGLWDWNLETGEITRNERWADLLGYTLQEIESTAKQGLALIHPDDQAAVLKSIQDHLEGRTQEYESEYRMLAKDKRYKWILDRGRIVQWDNEGRPLRMSGTHTDITERRELGEQLVKAQKMEAVGVLAGGVAHDFNNLLTAIMGYSELMQMGLPSENPLPHYIEEIAKAANRGASLTRQLLAFSRKQILQPQVINLNDVVRDMDKMLRRLIGEDIDLRNFLDHNLGLVKADPSQIEQIIMNLAVNARDALPQGGKLTIETANVLLDESYAKNHVEVIPGPYVMLVMSDDGIGMDVETRSHIFEPFFTTKKDGKGTGLGLATVYGIVKQSGGYIWVYSEPGQGTTFKIYLPQVEEPKDRIKEETIEVVSPISLEQPQTILVVEDDAALRELISITLRKDGFTVLAAAHGGEAMLLGEAEKGPIHLLLTDVVMPQMSGRVLAERLNPNHPEMKVLFMSGYTENAIVRHGILYEGINFIPKPFKIVSLIRKIREVLGTGASS